MSDVTEILYAIESGNGSAAAELLPHVYAELRALAVSRMNQESPGHTLQPTALVHEAYVRLVDTDRAAGWDSRGHFFAAASEAMRRILIEHARHKKSLRRGGELARLDVDLELLGKDPDVNQLLALDESITELSKVDERAARLVEMRCFGGLSMDAAASMLGISTRAAYREWAWARAWLFRHQHGDDQESNSC